jgi:hypothetical protein
MPTTYAIPNGSTAFAATTYTGTGAALTLSNAVNGTSFQPDLVWMKSRSNATDHELVDSVRGATKSLVSNSTAAEATDANGLTAFGSTGFTLGTDANYNGSGRTFVGWQWKANGAAVTNTAGSITSQVSANTTAGFSVVTYTGTGANATVGHGLGVAPSMVIVKRRDGGSDNWQGYHISLGKNYTIKLNTTQAQENLSDYWGTGGVTSTVFGINGTYSGINANTGTYVAYCWAAVPGYSAFGSYTGNGSSDGPFVYLGFRPRYVMRKKTSGVARWIVEDSAREPSNVANTALYPNFANAEEVSTVNWGIDFLSNGFKIRSTDTDSNESGGTYIYAAFAETPFAYSNAR